MIKKAVSILKYSVSLLLAVALLYFAFRNVDFAEFMAKAKTVDYFWVIISIALSLSAYYVRAYRWNILLKPMGYTNLTNVRTTSAVLIGYLANLAFPRLGEITRCGMLKKSDGVPVSTSLGTVITERIIDVISLLVLMLFTLITQYDVLLKFLEQLFTEYVDMEGLAWKLAIAGVVFIVVVVVLIFLARSAGPRISEFIKSLYQGILSLKNITNVPGFVISTIVLWVVYYFMSYLIVFSLPETSHLGWMVGVMLLVTGGIALAIPVQGGFGTYHTLISVMLSLYAVDPTTGIFLATLLHTSQVVAVAVFGSLALLLAFVFKPKATEERPTTD
jgi:glycosyltransferase 2 family protein